MNPSDELPPPNFELNPAPPPAAPEPAVPTVPAAASAWPDAADDAAEEGAAALAAWKDELRHDFETWLASLETVPELAGAADDEANDGPDLYAFYEQLVAATTESRKANRRTAEAMSQWGETLARFEGGLQPLRETAAQLAAAQPKAGRMARPHCLLLVELLDRMYRLAAAFAAEAGGKPAWWAAAIDRAWRERWTSQRQAFDILIDHVEGLLAKEGVTRIETRGQPFDPALMMAVSAEDDSALAPQTVIEEMAAGYLRDGELLRPAQVKVAR